MKWKSIYKYYIQENLVKIRLLIGKTVEPKVAWRLALTRGLLDNSTMDINTGTFL